MNIPSNIRLQNHDTKIARWVMEDGVVLRGHLCSRGGGGFGNIRWMKCQKTRPSEKMIWVGDIILFTQPFAFSFLLTLVAFRLGAGDPHAPMPLPVATPQHNDVNHATLLDIVVRWQFVCHGTMTSSMTWAVRHGVTIFTLEQPFDGC